MTTKSFRIRSYVPRGRRTEAQNQAYEQMWPHFGLEIENDLINYRQVFGRDANCFLEIGFGSGQSLLAVAKAQPNHDFIGVETHQPGIGALLMGISKDQLTNLRVYNGDVIDVLQKCIPADSLSGVHIFFPDPWQKRRHHERRLIQAPFLQLVIAKMKPGGVLHLATDWEDYAVHMLRIISFESQLINLAGVGQFAERSSQRPVMTKFETRAIREGRGIWELQLQVNKYSA